MGRILRITLFCGGRGSASLIREILRIPEAELNLIVNAYDNGGSTGVMRRYIPGYLGPSDFRKNLSYLLELYSPDQYILSKLIDYRFADSLSKDTIESFISYINGFESKGRVLPEVFILFQSINERLKQNLFDYLRNFFQYYQNNEDIPFDFNNCSLGNIIFAGAFLKNKKNFEKATLELMDVFKSKTNAKLLNVTTGENRFLMALKENGEVLEDEAKIVREQSSSKYHGLYLIPEQLTEEELKLIKAMDFRSKREFFESRHRDVNLSGAAKDAIINSDIIVYGPGTQFSSLLPSYMTNGLGEVISCSKALLKVFIVNINKDYDIQSYNVEDLIDSALNYLGGSEPLSLITHILYNKEGSFKREGIRFREDREDKASYKNIPIIFGEYEHPLYAGIHSGTRTVRALLDLYDNKIKFHYNELDIYVDLNERSLAVKSMIDEFLELDWKKQVEKVRLYINNVNLPEMRLPHNVEIYSTKNLGYFSEVDIFNDWYWNKQSKYLVTITGDGEYRLDDIIHGIDILTNTSFGALYGSRNQSRQQFIRSINAAYGESRLLYHASRFGAILVGILCALRFRIFLSDPLTGLRVYNRRVLEDRLSIPRINKKNRRLKTPMALTRCIAKDGIEIAEIPVRYRTFKGFTNIKWRLLRGLKNLGGVFF